MAGGLFLAVARLQQGITEMQGQVEVELSLWFFKSNDFYTLSSKNPSKRDNNNPEDTHLPPNQLKLNEEQSYMDIRERETFHRWL